MPDTTNVCIDLENNAEIWWDAARKRTDCPPCLRPIIDGTEHTIAIPTDQVPIVRRWCESIPGWADGPRHARTALFGISGDGSTNITTDARDLVTSSLVRSTCAVYRFRFKGIGWAHFYVDDDAGTLAIVSDYGSWSYRWGRGPNLGVASGNLSDAIAIRLGNQYLADKHCAGEAFEYSPEKTEEALRTDVLLCRMEREIDRKEARKRWNAIDHIDFSHRDFAIQQIMDEPDLECFHVETWELMETVLTQKYLVLRDQLLPKLIEALRTEIAAGAEEPTG